MEEREPKYSELGPGLGLFWTNFKPGILHILVTDDGKQFNNAHFNPTVILGIEITLGAYA